MKFIKKIFFIFLIIISTSYPICYSDDIDYLDFSEYNTLETSSSTFEVPSLNSKSAIILEKSTGAILFGKNENEKRKMASTTKIMTAIVVLENAQDFSQTIVVSKNAAGIGGSRLGLVANAKISLNDLLYGLLLCSGNDAAIALSEFIGRKFRKFCCFNESKSFKFRTN